jgi:hypothetical protein
MHAAMDTRTADALRTILPIAGWGEERARAIEITGDTDPTRVLAGPTCARTLAEHGADVLKITAAHLPNLGYQEYDTGHGKLSAHLDLRQAKDVETLRGLVRDGDVFSAPGPQFYPVSAIDYLTGYLMAFGSMVALAGRAREGGSWLVRISVAQTGRWLVGRGQVPEAQLEDVPKEFTPSELGRWTIASDTPAGRLHHLGLCCASRRLRRAGRAPRCRSVITRPCGRRGPRSRQSVASRSRELSVILCRPS